MAKRKIIKIDEEKCNGCGLCIPNCPGLIGIISEAISQSGKDIPFQEVIISIKGEKIKC
jgi:Fe-S-cluster-containing hydrogenase component 2